MLKNILATLGLAVVAKAAYEHYREYLELKRAQQERERNATPGAERP